MSLEQKRCHALMLALKEQFVAAASFCEALPESFQVSSGRALKDHIGSAISASLQIEEDLALRNDARWDGVDPATSMDYQELLESRKGLGSRSTAVPQ